MEALDQLLTSGVNALKRKQFQTAQHLLERYSQEDHDPLSANSLKAKMHLVEVYQQTGQQQAAIALCHTLIQSEHPKVQSWARRMLTHLTGTPAPSPDQSPKPPKPSLKTAAGFKQHYEQELLADLQDLEQQRRAMLIKVVPLTLAIALALGLIMSTFFPWFYAVFAAGIVALISLQALTHPFKRKFKERIIRKILAFIDPSGGFSYVHRPTDRRATRRTFIESKLFGGKPDRFHEEDCVTGRWGETALYFSEITAERHTGENDYQTIFSGLFFQADFNKSFQGRTIVVPDLAEKMFGSFGKLLQSWNKRYASELIKLEDPEFERLFAVYGTDQVEARYILSTSLMQRFVDFRHKLGRDIRVGFMNDKVYVAICYRRNLFEPRLFKSLLRFEPALDYFETLQLAIGIVEELNLNRRIWQR